MKYAVLGDIHGNIAALEVVLEDMDKEEIDGVMILGDIVMVGPAPYEVLNKIKQINPECWISGNTDLWFEDMKDLIQKTEKEQELYEYYRYAKQKIPEKDVTDLISLPSSGVKPLVFNYGDISLSFFLKKYLNYIPIWYIIYLWNINLIRTSCIHVNIMWYGALNIGEKSFMER